MLRISERANSSSLLRTVPPAAPRAAAILGYDAHYGENNPYHAQIEQWNMYFLYVFTAAVHVTFLVYVVTRVFRRELAPEEQHIQFTAALAAAATASRVYEDEFEHLAEQSEELADGERS